MSDGLIDAAAVIVVAVVVIASVTTLALRREATRPAAAWRIRPESRTDAFQNAAGGRSASILASLPTWGGVLVTLLLASRGKLVLAAIALVATIVHAWIARARGNAVRRRTP